METPAGAEHVFVTAALSRRHGLQTLSVLRHGPLAAHPPVQLHPDLPTGEFTVGLLDYGKKITITIILVNIEVVII